MEICIFFVIQSRLLNWPPCKRRCHSAFSANAIGLVLVDSSPVTHTVVQTVHRTKSEQFTTYESPEPCGSLCGVQRWPIRKKQLSLSRSGRAKFSNSSELFRLKENFRQTAEEVAGSAVPSSGAVEHAPGSLAKRFLSMKNCFSNSR